MRIKVCGMTLPEQVTALDEMGVDLAGFIFYPKSPRYAGNKISPEKMRQIKGKIAKVGVFVNMPYDELVKTVEDFGSQGEWPIHPELLDWLAVDFRESGWDMKHVLHTIVTSNTYRQSSKASPALVERDPENRLLARGARMRLSPEMVRDQALAASGLLVDKVGGPSVRPPQPPGLWQELAGGKDYEADPGEGRYRRSLYTYWRRTIAPPSMVTFDSPTRETCVVRETRTNTPLQALNLMNDEVFLEAARKLGEQMAAHSSGDPLSWAFIRVLGRAPRPPEAEVLSRTFRQFYDRYQTDRSAAVKFAARDNAEAPKQAAFTTVASLILNLDEAVTKE